MKLWSVISGIVLLIGSSVAFSANLTCEIRLSNSLILRRDVATQKQAKTVIGETGEISAYVLEKENQHYTIEALLPEMDARIYAEGSLRELQDRVVASLWGRTLLVDVECRIKSLNK